MYTSNLTDRAESIKRKASIVTKLALALVLMVVVNCSKDPTSVLVGDHDYSGTYVATYAVEMVDDEVVYNYGGSNIAGLMIISDTLYALHVDYAVGNGFFSRPDAGKLILYDGYVDFASAEDTLLQSTARGYYDSVNEQLKIFYIRGNNLWTEYWKLARPVADGDTTTHIPF